MQYNQNLSAVFTPTYWNSNTTYGDYITTTPTVWSSGWSEPTMVKAKQDPLHWLKGEVGRYVDLGTLDE